MGYKRLFLLGASCLPALSSMAEPVSRTPVVSGQVVQTRAGEDISFVDIPTQHSVEVRQDVKAGDVIRTNAVGQIALLFSDRTQIRLGRSSTLLVRDVRADGGVSLELKAGQLFGRASRGGSGVVVDTPAAAAAIRGTDWTLTVDGKRTTLSVIEGRVDLSNAQGAVSVAGGESAAATIGSAPSKVIISGGDVREQMLFNLTLRSAFANAQATGPEVSRLRREQQRLALLPAGMASADDDVSAAEVAMARRGRQDAVRAIAKARRKPLSASQSARLDYLDGRIAADSGRYGDAARYFHRAERALSGDQQVSARYMAYFADSMANPLKHYRAPEASNSSVADVMGQEMIAAIVESPRKALQVLLAAEPRFGNDVRFQVAIANRALLASDFDAAKRALEKAQAIDAADPAFLDARASYASYVTGDIRGALRDQKRAVNLDPANMEYWNNLALLEAGRGAYREAERAYKRAIEIDPGAPEPLANYAALLLRGGRNKEAKELIDRALAIDPSYDVALFQRGRQKLQSGDEEGGLEDMLKATAANPTYGKGLLTLGATYAANGEMDPARQSFELADQLDPLAPDAAQYRALLSVDQDMMDDAIRFARESVRRARARGGDYTSVESSDDFGSTLGGVYRSVALDAWARYWGDRTFDPFQGASYFDQNLSGSVRPYFASPNIIAIGEPNTGDDAAFSGYVQGLMLDPLAIASPRQHAAFYRVPFQEVEFGSGIVADESDATANGSASYQVLGYDPLPYAMSASVTGSYLNPSYADQEAKNLNASATFGIQMTPDDRFVGHFNAIHAEGGVSYRGAIDNSLEVTRGDTLDADGFNGFVGWSHTFAYHNILNLGLFGSVIEKSGRDSLYAYDLLPPPIGEDIDVDENQHSLKGGFAHLVEVGDGLTVRYGAEGGHTEYEASGSVTDYLIGLPSVFVTFPGNTIVSEGDNARAWAGFMWGADPSLEIEATLFADWFKQNDVEDNSFNPHIGVAWEPMEGQYLRAAFVQQTPLSELNTLSPVATVGLRPDLPPDGTGRTKTSILRWDAEWTERFFTAVEYQHQGIENLSLSLPVYSFPIAFEDATIDRLSVTGNLWIGQGWSAFGNYTRIWAGADAVGFENILPLVPENVGRVGLNFVSPERFSFTIAETYLGQRLSFPSDLLGLTDLAELDSAFITDVGAGWETEDRHLSASISVSNIFDRRIDVAPLVPGAGRTISANIRARF